jgi:hypothetical protein
MTATLSLSVVPNILACHIFKGFISDFAYILLTRHEHLLPSVPSAFMSNIDQ